MKKAFSQNVPKVKPRLRFGPAGEVELQAPESEASELSSAAASPIPEPSQTRAEPAAPVREEPREPARAHEHARATAHSAAGSRFTAPHPSSHPPAAKAEDLKSRREKLKVRLAAAAGPLPAGQRAPETAAETRASALAIVEQFRAELERATSLNVAMQRDLESARKDLARAAAEAREKSQEAGRLHSQLEERIKLIAELTQEMQSLEAERDDALAEMQQAREQVGANQEELLKAQEQLRAREKELAEAVDEEERLATQLELKGGELHAARKAVEALGAEREALARQVAELTLERNEMLEAQKALGEIHKALSEARSRVS